jgi:hypothetical protein
MDEAFGILMSGFLRGGTGFLKGTGEIIKGSSAINRDVRVGVTHVCKFVENFVAVNERLGVHDVLIIAGLRYIHSDPRR